MVIKLEKQLNFQYIIQRLTKLVLLMVLYMHN
nr:MAG TPA: hypothetical protein [Bacteriophage sp.]